MRIAGKQGRKSRSSLKIGICGEHGDILLRSAFVMSGAAIMSPAQAESADRLVWQLLTRK